MTYSSFKVCLNLFKKELSGTQHLSVDESICFFQFLFKDFAGLGSLKSYLWAFVKTNTRNELGDMISEPYAKFNRFGVMNQIGFFIFVQKIV